MAEPKPLPTAMSALDTLRRVLSTESTDTIPDHDVQSPGSLSTRIIGRSERNTVYEFFGTGSVVKLMREPNFNLWHDEWLQAGNVYNGLLKAELALPGSVFGNTKLPLVPITYKYLGMETDEFWHDFIRRVAPGSPE